LCGVLALLTLAYWGKGLYFLAAKPTMPSDLRLRWVDERYVFARRNPYDVFFASPYGQFGQRPLWNPRDTSPLPGLNAPYNAGYPPWGFFAGAIFFWPDWPAVRVYYAAINVLAGALIFIWGYSTCRRHGALAGLAAALATTAVGSNCTTLGVGQYGIVIVAMLVGTLWLAQKNRRIESGVLLGLSLTKPTLSGPFGLPFLIGRYWRVIVGLIGYLILSDLVIDLVTRTNPIEMTLQMLRAGQTYMRNEYGPLNLLLAAGIPEPKALAITAGAFLLTAAALNWLWAGAPLLIQFAIASVAGRLWTYHQHYDNLIIVFLLIAIYDLAIRSKQPRHILIFVLVGISLWAPAKMCDILFFQIFQMVIWSISLAFLLVATPRRNGTLAQGVENLS
jgi:hypothetical protein